MVAAAASVEVSEGTTYSPEDRGRFATTFDRLVDANLRLTASNHALAASVKDLVRACYVGLSLSFVGGTLTIWALVHGH